MNKTQKNEKTKAAEKPIEKPTEKELSKKEKKEVQVIEKIIESKAIAPQDVFGKLNRTQIELIKRTIAKGSSDYELRLFIQVCNGAQLNPFMKQVFLVPRWDSKEGKEVRAIQVSIDGFRSIAEGSGAYAGNDDPIYDGESQIKVGTDKKEITVPLKATVAVYKVVEGQRYSFTATARWGEYYPGEKIGFQWHIRPYLMLGKCAEALALRKAFPKLLSGMYAQEEMDQGISQEKELENNQKAFQTLLGVIQKASLKELAEYKTKMEKSDKYSDKQKADFFKLLQERFVKELNKKDANA